MLSRRTLLQTSLLLPFVSALKAGNVLSADTTKDDSLVARIYTEFYEKSSPKKREPINIFEPFLQDGDKLCRDKWQTYKFKNNDNAGWNEKKLWDVYHNDPLNEMKNESFYIMRIWFLKEFPERVGLDRSMMESLSNEELKLKFPDLLFHKCDGVASFSKSIIYPIWNGPEDATTYYENCKKGIVKPLPDIWV